jgi:ubiquinone/menaquinone biosynthesis C-methylase UbiE
LTTRFAMNSFRGKQVLALIRDGDFAHAGEEEAIELTMAEIPKNPDQQLLDAGCGRGGTAAYLQSHGWGEVTGFDVEAQSIERARTTYPELRFLVCDVCDVADRLDRSFNVITMFNVLYALPDHGRALKALASVARKDARLVIFDYVDPGRYQYDPLFDSDGPFLPHPPKVSELSDTTLAAAGWQLQKIKEINEDYQRWYVALVDKIEAKRAPIEALAEAEGYAHVHGLYSGLLTALRSGRLGGATIHARRLA